MSASTISADPSARCTVNGRFGFSADKTGALWLPGPYARERLLARELVPGALAGAHGLINPTGRIDSKTAAVARIARAA